MDQQGLGDEMMLEMVEDKEKNITCMTSHSNPAPTISWQLGEKVLESVQRTSSERHEAVLTYSFQRSSSGDELKCIVRHGAYPTGQRVITVILDILCKECLHGYTVPIIYYYRYTYSKHC